jgi:hypothetical protein
MNPVLMMLHEIKVVCKEESKEVFELAQLLKHNCKDAEPEFK